MIALGMHTPAYADWLGLWEDEAAQHYHVVVTASQGSPDALVSYLSEVEKNLQSRPAADSDDEGYLRYRFEQDTVYVRKALEAEGYYKADIVAHYDETGHRAAFTVTPGVQYHFGSIRIVTDDNVLQRKVPLNIPDNAVVAALEGSPGKASTVLEDEAALKTWIEEHNCLFDYEVGHEAVLNHTQQRIDITYRIRAGREAAIGDIRFEGSQSISPDYLAKVIAVKKGDCFKRSTINDAQVTLQRTGLIARAKPQLPPAPDADGSVPLVFAISDRAQRTVKAGASYSTDIGPGFTAGWEHRNLFAHGEKLVATATLTPIKRALDTALTKPYFMRDDQKLTLGTKLEQQDSDAFTSTGITLSGSIERSFDNHWLAGIGSKYAVSRIDDLTSKQNVALLSFPLFASQDTRNDALDPSTGWTLRGDTEPFLDTLDSNTVFLKNQLEGTYYRPLPVSTGSVLALRAASGNIMGISTGSVPATERYYTGGAGSVRGYAFQEAGPLDANGDPLGGRSYVETSIELRFRFAGDYGLVTFLDGGNTFDATYPDFEDGLRWGAGLGARYYTSFGPLRADIAFPLDKRRSDDSFQLYFSIGQAF